MCVPVSFGRYSVTDREYNRRFQQIMHSVLACRMLLDLHEYGKITVHGDEFLDYTSSGPLPRDKLGFHPAGAATVSDSSFDPDSLSATITHDENPC